MLLACISPLMYDTMFHKPYSTTENIIVLYILIFKFLERINTFKYHVFAPMGRFQLELIYIYFPPSSHQIFDNI